MARKTDIPADPSTLFDFDLGDEHRRLREPAAHGVRSRPGKEIRHELSGEARPQCQSLRPQCQSLFGNPRWISLISSCSHEIDSTAGRAVKGSLRWPKLHGERRGNGSRRSSRCLSPRPQLRDFTKAIILPNPQALPNPSVLAVKGSLRRFATYPERADPHPDDSSRSRPGSADHRPRPS